MSKIPPISDQGLALLRTAASGQRQLMQLLHEQVRSLIARLDAAEERVKFLEEAEERVKFLEEATDSRACILAGRREALLEVEEKLFPKGRVYTAAKAGILSGLHAELRRIMADETQEVQDDEQPQDGGP